MSTPKESTFTRGLTRTGEKSGVEYTLTYIDHFTVEVHLHGIDDQYSPMAIEHKRAIVRDEIRDKIKYYKEK